MPDVTGFTPGKVTGFTPGKVSGFTPQAAPQVGSGGGVDALVSKYAAQYGVPVDFANKIRGVESGGTPNPATATSSAGARGIFQIMPATFAGLGVGNDITNPEQNVHGGIKYLAQLLQRYHGNQELAAAAYNAGPGAVDRAGGVPNIAETRKYEQKLGFTSHQSHVSGFTPSATRTPQPENPIQEANQGFMGVMAEGERRLAESVRHPIDAVLNVEQTLQRGVTGFASSLEKHENPLAAMGHAVFNALNPDDAQGDLDKINNQVADVIQRAGPGLFPHKETPAEHFVGHFMAQMITDPFTVLPAINVAKKAAMSTKLAQGLAQGAAEVGVKIPGVTKALTVGNAIHDAYVTHIGNEFGKMMEMRPELNEHLTATGKSGRLGIEHRNLTKMQDELGHSDMDLLKRNDKALRGVKMTDVGYALPEEVRQRYLQEAWRYGTPDMRQQAENLGYHPISSDKPWEHSPEGLLDYDLRKDYQYIGDLNKNMENSPAFSSIGAKYGKKQANFELTRNGNWNGIEPDQRARVAARLQMGRDFVRKRRVDAETKGFLEKYGGWKSKDAVDVTKLSHSPKTIAAASPLRFLSRAGKQTVLASALPHLLNNMGTLLYWQGGMPALGRAAGYMVKGLDESQIARIKAMGAHNEYIQDFSKILGHNIPGVRQWLRGSNAILDRGELAMRQAILDELDKTMGPSKSIADEFAKAQKVRDALGDYRNVSAFISLMDALGAPFAPFMGVFSKAAKKTIPSDKASRFFVPLRLQQDADQASEDSGQQGNFTVPNPSAAFSQLVTGGGWLSPSRTGPLPQVISNIDASKTGNVQIPNIWDVIGEQAASYGGPLLGNIGSFFGLPYPAPGHDALKFDPLTGLIHLFLGDYWKNPMSEKPDMRIQRSANRASDF